MEEQTIKALLAYSSTERMAQIQETIPKFVDPLKTNFENKSLWIRFGLTLSLSQESPRSAIQAFHECLRIDQDDPLPAMLAVKLMLEQLDDPQDALQLSNEAVERCQRLSDIARIGENNVSQLTARSYLLVSIVNAYLYEREVQSIRQKKSSNLESSLHYLDLAIKTNRDDYLVHFHKALHEARQKSYSLAINSIRQAIKLNPNHVPSIQLLILSLSGLKLHDDALNLCESALLEFPDNLMILYLKSNLEQVGSRGYKKALATAQHMLKCIRKSSNQIGQTAADQVAKSPAAASHEKHVNLFAEDIPDTGYEKEFSVWLLVAEIFVKIGSLSDAELCVDEASFHVKGALSHQIMYIRGLIAKARNNFIESKSFLQSCLALQPRYGKALQQIGHIHHLLGNHVTAEKFLKDALEIDYDEFKTWHYLSLVYIETNQHTNASGCAKKATLLEDSSPVVPISIISRITLE